VLCSLSEAIRYSGFKNIRILKLMSRPSHSEFKTPTKSRQAKVVLRMDDARVVDGMGLDGGDEGVLWPFPSCLSNEPMLICFLSMTDSTNGHDKSHSREKGCAARCAWALVAQGTVLRVFPPPQDPSSP